MKPVIVLFGFMGGPSVRNRCEKTSPCDPLDALLAQKQVACTADMAGTGKALHFTFFTEPPRDTSSLPAGLYGLNFCPFCGVEFSKTLAGAVDAKEHLPGVILSNERKPGFC